MLVEQSTELAAGPRGHTVTNSWLTPGPAAFDFRGKRPIRKGNINWLTPLLRQGDVRTTPTARMLDGITNASLLDGLDRSDTSTRKLEECIASLTGHEAALWVVSGTMGNLVSLRSLLAQPPYGVLCDERAHCLTNEAGGAFAFTGAIAQAVTPSNGRHLTLEDIILHIQLGNGERVHACPTRVICLENTLRGMVMPLGETKRISDFARENGIRMHLDGARLWETVSAGHGTMKEYCSQFDTVSLCFTKGLGAPAGAIVVGSESLIRHGRWIRQSIGGSIRQPGLLAEAAYVGVQDTFLGNRLAPTHTIALKIASHWAACGGKLKYPTETNMVWLDFRGQPFGLDELIAEGAKLGIRIHRDRLVVHYQITEEAVDNLLKVMSTLTKHKYR